MIKYKPGLPRPHGLCELCVTQDAFLHDHCHKHGWIRGRLCRDCNRLMWRVDNRKPVRSEITDLTIKAYQAQCRDCTPVQIVREFPPSLARGLISVMLADL